jgi:hypothetical protein
LGEGDLPVVVVVASPQMVCPMVHNTRVVVVVVVVADVLVVGLLHQYSIDFGTLWLLVHPLTDDSVVAADTVVVAFVAAAAASVVVAAAAVTFVVVVRIIQ